MEFDQLIKYSVRNNFFKSHGENDVRRLVPNLFLFFKKTIHKIKASGQHLSFYIFW